MQSNEQKLIDIMFEIGLMIHNHPSFKDKNNEEICDWIRKQLKECGFETKPIGSSWGVLIMIDKEKIKELEKENKELKEKLFKKEKENSSDNYSSGWDFHWDGRGDYLEARRCFYGDFS